MLDTIDTGTIALKNKHPFQQSYHLIQMYRPAPYIYTITKQSHHRSIRKTGTDMGVGTVCWDYTLNIISRADQDHIISHLLSLFRKVSICKNYM